MSRRLALSRGEIIFSRPRIMGILNATPDSFSDGGSYADVQDVCRAVKRMEQQGADIIDIGGQSTRPGSRRLSPQEEWARIEHILPAVTAVTELPISIDTYHPEVAALALSHGAGIINDVTGFEREDMRRIAAEHGCGCIIMHSADITGRANPVECMREFFLRRVEQCLAAGIKIESLCLDVGIGFGKTRQQELELIARMEETRVHELPMLAAISRKRVLAHCLASGGLDLAPKDRDIATVAANTAAILAGADMIRVHDVPSAYQCVLVTSHIRDSAKFRNSIIQ